MSTETKHTRKITRFGVVMGTASHTAAFGFGVREDGNYVLLSDYAELEAQNKELREELEYHGKHNDSCGTNRLFPIPNTTGEAQ